MFSLLYIGEMTRIQSQHRYKIHDKLYDLTDFVKVHPGGIDMFNNLKPDTNITPMIYSYHKNPKSILEILPKYEVPLTNLIKIEYDTHYNYDKYCELKKLVYDEIHENKIPLYWSNKEIGYNAFMLSIYLGIWGHCFWNANNLSYWWMVLLAFMNMGYGALVFHETSHFTGFKNQKLNNIISYFVMSPIITTQDWKYEHNYLHHSFTNTIYDNDYELNKQIFRHSNTHTHYFNHRFQHIYAYIMFMLGGFSKGPLSSITNKRWNILPFITILYYFGYVNTIIMYGLSGLLFLSIAQVSHIQLECIQINTENKNDFLYNQVSSSMNYRTNDPITRFICFGLDIQIEHHLFPNIPHSSLRQIQYIVRGYCEKNDIPYIENPNVFLSIYSYIYYLYKMGNP
jgi:linoleoyl-CoA desaturase